MKRFALLALVLCVGGVGLVGCGGDNKDTSTPPSTPTTDTKMAPAPGGDKMSGDKMSGDKMSGDKMSGDKMAGDKMSGDKMSGDKMGAAGGVKDKVEAALKADDKTKGETITVEEKAGKVMLKGEVADNDVKKAAGDAATKALTEAKSTDKLINSLTVKKH